METDLYTLEPQYWEDDTKAREYNHEDDTPVTKEDAIYIVKHNIDKVTIIVEEDDDEDGYGDDDEANGSLFIQVDTDDASMFTILMGLVAIAYPDIDQTYFKALDEVMECVYVPDEDAHVAEKKMITLIEEIKAK